MILRRHPQSKQRNWSVCWRDCKRTEEVRAQQSHGIHLRVRVRCALCACADRPAAIPLIPFWRRPLEFELCVCVFRGFFCSEQVSLFRDFSAFFEPCHLRRPRINFPPCWTRALCPRTFSRFSALILFFAAILSVELSDQHVLPFSRF